MLSKPKNHGGARPGAGRKAKEKTVTTGFRVHEESLNYLRSIKYPLNKDVNNLVKDIAKKEKEKFE